MRPQHCPPGTDTRFRARAQVLSRARLSASTDHGPPRPLPEVFPSKNTGVGLSPSHGTHLSLTEMPRQVSIDHFYLPVVWGKKYNFVVGLFHQNHPSSTFLARLP